MGDEHVYVGESADLARRFVSYRNAGASQTTNIRMNERLVPLLRLGVVVEVDTATTVILGGSLEAAEADLTWKPHRILAESSALIQARSEGTATIFNL